MEFELDLVSSVALTLVLLLSGNWAARNWKIFSRFAIPGPVVGGFLFALVVLILRESVDLELTIDTTLQSPAMLAFFTTIGLGASLSLMKTGGRYLIIYLVACWGVAIFQNLVGIGLAKALDINALLGVMAGAVSLEGGHGTAAAFGPTAEELGAEGATAVAIAAATFGLIAGSLIGGPLATWLIKHHGLEIKTRDIATIEEQGVDETSEVGEGSIIATAALIGIIVVIGVFLGSWFGDVTGYSLPGYVGAMLIAIIFRNLNDKFGSVALHGKSLSLISELSLGFFLTQAMMSLKIWDLYSLALPLFIILVVQVAVLVAFVVFVVFRVLGRDYDAAVICGGMMGHGLGGTPNAVANMDAIGRRHGLQSRVAMIVVPLSGAVLIDIVALPWIVFCINWVA
ncbi:sodium/glutamate symporter [Corynebacterium coyleae]|uniref:sodium/glutamate symporter n=1 Tax=Corynebacterium coyleae TaxID=53374 RepID=UPI002549E655|nr:sodium/glutamate symporter [Corynebacterium coyleae]MDK8664546.1 sodium/glutamate symporter [Corynebacterium coyleae]MDK8707559.1 sodium/glutamate symporter [Corynebacterium coyleae]MDK8734407.1 sodium/glutamate symporter [Corynebacterium coyleae]MDK8893696.1 sodium/glutamate symporter [Corynebacterium coyleae]